MKSIGNYFAKSLCSIILLFLTISVYSQKETVLYIGKNGKLTDMNHADIMQKIKVNSSKKTTVESFQLDNSKWKKIYTERFKQLNDSTFQINGSSKSETKRSYRIFKPVANGTFQFRDIYKKHLVRVGNTTSIIPLSIDGQLTEYYKNGKKKSVSEFRNNELVSNQNWNENGEKYIDNIFYSVDEEPTFKPGNEVLRKYLRKNFTDAGIDFSDIRGTILISFVIMEDGTIDGIRILKGIVPSINTIAFQSFSDLKGEWKPARLNNQNVRYYQVFPINFIYKEQHFEFAEMRGTTLHWAAF